VHDAGLTKENDSVALHGSGTAEFRRRVVGGGKAGDEGSWVKTQKKESTVGPSKKQTR